MSKIIKLISIVILIAFISLLVLYCFVENTVILSITITIGVFAYHFVMRLIVGLSVNAILKNKIDCDHWWFRQKHFEIGLYSFLKVKKWKKYMPTFSRDTFDIKKHSLEEIVQATCQSEIIHEIIILLSFLPILLSIFYGVIAVFLCTSIIAAVFDSLFVIMQRFNRPRLLKLIERKNEVIY